LGPPCFIAAAMPKALSIVGRFCRAFAARRQDAFDTELRRRRSSPRTSSTALRVRASASWDACRHDGERHHTATMRDWEILL